VQAISKRLVQVSFSQYKTFFEALFLLSKKEKGGKSTNCSGVYVVSRVRTSPVRRDELYVDDADYSYSQLMYSLSVDHQPDSGMRALMQQSRESTHPHVENAVVLSCPAAAVVAVRTRRIPIGRCKKVPALRVDL
jgi:hypothetical protein